MKPYMIGNVLYGESQKVCDFVGRIIGFPMNGEALGVMINNELVGGVVYNNFTGGSIDATIATKSAKWLNRNTLFFLSSYPFLQLKCNRVGGIVDVGNYRSLAVAQKFGFEIEGMLRKYRPNGADVFVLGMTKEQWLKRIEKHGKSTKSPARA